MAAPIQVLRPQVVGIKRAAQALIGHHVGHTALGMKFARLFLKIFLGAYRPIRSVSAHAVIGRTGNIVQSGMQHGHRVAQSIIKRLGGIALVAAAINANAGVIAYFKHKILGIIHKHRLIIGVRTIGWVGQPKVLPHHNAVAVTSFKELLVAGHTHPVTNHVIIHLLVVAHGSIKLPAAIIQIILTKRPVATQRYQASVINVDAQFSVPIHRFDLTDAGLEINSIALHAINRERETSIIQVGLAITVRPPQPHPLVLELREPIRIK